MSDVNIGVLCWPALNPTRQAGMFVQEAPTLRTNHAWRKPLLGWDFNGLPTAELQARVDQHIRWAHHAGVGHFAYDWYPADPATPETPIIECQQRHVASDLRHLVKHALIIYPDEATGTGAEKNLPTYWRSHYVPWFVAQMQDTGYQMVTIDGVSRPLIYSMFTAAWTGALGFGSDAAAGAEFDYLIDAVQDAGLNRPYFVDLAPGGGFEITSRMDAIGGYGVFNTIAQGPLSGMISWETVRANRDANWRTVAMARSDDLVPPMTNASNPAPRTDAGAADPTNFGWTSFYQWWSDHPTYRQWEDHVADTVAFVEANPDRCPAQAILIHGWEEIEEGAAGCVPTEQQGFMWLEAIRAVMTGDYPATYVDSVNGNSKLCTRSGTWTRQFPAKARGAWEGDDEIATQTNAYLELTHARATGFVVQAIRGPDRAIAEILVDGVSQGTVDLYATAWSRPRTVFKLSGLAAGSHTIRIRHTGTANAGNVQASKTIGVDVIHVLAER